MKHKVWITRKDKVRQRYLKSYSYLTPKQSKQKGFLKLAKDPKEVDGDFWVRRDNSNDIMIGGGYKNISDSDSNITALSSAVGHEKLHHVLEKEIGRRAFKGLDLISTPIYSVTDRSTGKEELITSNPESLGIVAGKSKRLQATRRMIEDLDNEHGYYDADDQNQTMEGYQRHWKDIRDWQKTLIKNKYPMVEK